MLACAHEPSLNVLKNRFSPIIQDKNLKKKSQWAVFHSIKSEESLYLQTDRPPYKPGEEIWFKTLNFDSENQSKRDTISKMRYKLISPAGKTLDEMELVQEGISTQGSFENFICPLK